MLKEDSPEIVQFEKDLLETFKKYLPRIEFTGRSIHSESDGELLKISHRLGAIHHHLEESSYHYKGPFRFIYYTSSLHRAIEILQRKAFRISSLNSFNDPQEFNFIAKNSHFAKLKPRSMSGEHWQGMIDWWRRKTFAMSFCKYDEQSNESFEMWRLYGGDGKGVGIVFEIDCHNVRDWFGHYLSSMNYSDQENQELQINNLLGEISQLWERNQYPQIADSSKFPEILIALLSFHKDSIWKVEDEVRLVVVTTENTAPYKLISSLSFEDYSSIRQIDLEIFTNPHPDDIVVHSDPLTNQMNKHLKEWKASHYPLLRLKEIIVGYKHRPETIDRLMECVSDTCYENRIPHVTVRQSSLTSKFKSR